MVYKLSILVPAIESRRELLSSLICGLIPQCGSIESMETLYQKGCTILVIKFKDVEIISAIDDRIITTGEKRNLLLSLASNSHVSQIDEDDYVYPYYVEKALEAIQTNPDCVATNGSITTNGDNEIEWRLSKGYQNETIHENGRNIYLRTTNHISIVKRELALQAGFPDICNGEDKEFSIRLNPLLVTETKINEPMYLYRFSTVNKSYK